MIKAPATLNMAGVLLGCTFAPFVLYLYKPLNLARRLP
jgi:hypothetical protein